MNKKFDNKYLAWFLTFAGVIVFYFLILNLGSIFSFFAYVLNAFTPVAYGFVIAYLLNPLMKLIERLILKIKKKDETTKGIKILSIVFTFLFAAAIIYLIVVILSTQAVESIEKLINNSSAYIQDFGKWLESIASTLNKFTDNNAQISTLTDSIKNLVSSLATAIVGAVPDAISFVDQFATVIGELSLGFILSVYMLFDKENLIARLKKFIYAVIGAKASNKLIDFGRNLDDTVGGFITGKLLGSLIAGILSYVTFLICKFEFPALLALIIGICDIIPYFGPIIGGIPCGIILLIVAPKQVIPFVIALIIIEQIEGNIISPRILSKTTGVSGFWVIVALSVGGGLFGIIGMILSVPLFAVVYKLFTKFINFILQKRGIDHSLEFYKELKPEKTQTVEENPIDFSRLIKKLKPKKDKNKIENKEKK